MVGRNRREASLGLFLLASQLLGFGLENIPPVTLALIIGQAGIFLDMFPSVFPSANRVCMSSYLVYQHGDWSRMILATFYHANDLHLYYNMVSLLYKGTSLERRFGSLYFAYLVTVFSALTSMTYVGLGLVFSQLFDDENYITSCAVGFSGVLFALKVLKTHYSPPGTQYLFGAIPIPSKYVFWAELVLIQLFVPNASFTGHLAGILVGLAYTLGPLRILMDAILPPGVPSTRSSESLLLRRGPSSSSGIFQRTPGPYHSTRYPEEHETRPRPSPQTPSGSGAHRVYSGYSPYSQSQDLYDLAGDMDEEQQYQRAVEESLRNSPQPSTSAQASTSSQRLYPDLNDLRSRRSKFYH